MERALRTALTAFLAVSGFLGPVGTPAAPAPESTELRAGPSTPLWNGLVISGYSLVSWRYVGPTVVEYELRATLTNLGAPIPGATATATSICPALVVVDGALTFGALDKYRTVLSADTFTVRYDFAARPICPFPCWTIAPAGGNAPPVADAGPDQTSMVGGLIMLDGSRSSDADGDALSFAWRILSAPDGSTAILSDPVAVNPTFTADRPGEYTIELIVHDGEAPSAPDTVVISTLNSAPVAHAGPDQTTTVGATVTVDGSGSTDVDGDALTYLWMLTAVPEGSLAALTDPAAVMPSFVADLPGSYVAHLIVNDGQASSAPDGVTITTQNSAPIADAGPDRAAIAGQLVTLDGTASSDVDGDPLSFRWSLTTKPQDSATFLTDETTAQPSIVVDQPGTYVVQLLVNDGIADSAPDTVTITTGNTPPVADAGPDQQDVVAGTGVTLDASASSDADDHPLTYAWVLLAQPAGSAAVLTGATTASPAFTPDVAGDYVAQLIVHDGFVNSQPDTVLVRVVAPPAAIVTIEATDDSASEDGDEGMFTLTRTGPVNAPLVVNYDNLIPGSNGVDYETIPSSITIPAGASSTTIAVRPIDDDVIEGLERVELLVADGAGYTAGSPSLAIVSIADNDLPVVTVVATDAEAGEAGTATGTITFSRTGSTASQLLVLFSRGGTAVSGSSGAQDYAAVGLTVTIPANASEATVTIAPLADNLAEGDETVILTVNPSPGYVVGVPGAATVAIADDPAIVRIDASGPNASEAGAEPGTFVVSRSGGNIAASLTVRLGIGGTATNNSDYPLLSGLVAIPAAQPSLTIEINPIADNNVEGPETVVLTLQPVTGEPTYVIGTPGAATVTIADDAPVVGIVASDPEASEIGLDPGAFTITRSGGNLSAALLVFVSRSGTASNGLDYASLGGSTFIVTVPANETSAVVTITPLADPLAEPLETVTLTISPNTAYTIGTASATVTIADSP